MLASSSSTRTVAGQVFAYGTGNKRSAENGRALGFVTGLSAMGLNIRSAAAQRHPKSQNEANFCGRRSMISFTNL